jgi:hypothetical protein
MGRERFDEMSDLNENSEEREWELYSLRASPGRVRVQRRRFYRSFQGAFTLLIFVVASLLATVLLWCSRDFAAVWQQLVLTAVAFFGFWAIFKGALSEESTEIYRDSSTVYRSTHWAGGITNDEEYPITDKTHVEVFSGPMGFHEALLSLDGSELRLVFTSDREAAELVADRFNEVIASGELE